MKYLLFILFALSACQKDEIQLIKAQPIKVGAWHIQSNDTLPFRYYVNTSLTSEGFYITSDTIIDIYSNQVYKVRWNDTVVVSIDSIYWCDTLNHININYTRVTEHRTLFGEENLSDVLPCTVY